MLELTVVEKRIKFPKGAQRTFIETAFQKSTLSRFDFAKHLGVSTRTVADWKREKFLMTESALKKMSELSNIPLPKNIEILEEYWSVSKAGRVGGAAVVKNMDEFLHL